MGELTLDNWLQNHNINAEAAKLIQRIRSFPPSRLVQSGCSNVTGRYPSRKMGQTIQFESHKVELAFIKEYEFDDNVLEYYDQPEPIKISYRTDSGRLVTTLTTPDFFVIRNNGTAGWEECKPEQELERLATKSERFARDDDGIWRCRSAEEFAGRFGLYFSVRSSKEINWVWQRNIEYLSDYIPGHDVNPETKSFIKALVSCKQGIHLSELISCAERYTPDDVFQLIANKELYVNLHAHSLSEQDRAKVFIDSADALKSEPPVPCLESTIVRIEPGEQIIWDDKVFMIVNSGDNSLWLQDERGSLIHVHNDEVVGLMNGSHLRGINNYQDTKGIGELLQSMGPQSYADANTKYAAITPFLSGEAKGQPTSTIYNWLSRYKEAELRYGYGYLGLLDRKSQRGNRLPKLPAESYKLMQTVIDEQFLNSTQIYPTTAYGHYCNLCEGSGVIAASFKTFTVKLKELDAKEAELKRKGPRAAYQLDVFYWELELTTPRHGERPFEIAHLDHTELDIELVDSSTGNNLGRPWLTLMIDANSRRILAHLLSFEPPSYRSCMTVIRECVRIHNRLPQTIVVDNGAEFNSVYFEQLIAFHEITKKNRPKAQPRFGSVLERLFGVTNEQFIHALEGNTKIMLNVRQVTKSVNPANLAVWTFAKLNERVGRYFSEVYDHLDHPALGESPRKAFERGLAKHGLRPMKFVRYDDAFIFSTLPSTPKGYAKVIRSRGIKINNFYYWHGALRSAAGLNVPVRYDPYDIGTAYALVKGQWIRCNSQYYPTMKGRSEKEISVVTQEILRLRSNHNKKIAVNAQMIAAFIVETQEQEAELKLMRRAAEMRTSKEIMEEPVNTGPQVFPPCCGNDDFEIYDELTL